MTTPDPTKPISLASAASLGTIGAKPTTDVPYDYKNPSASFGSGISGPSTAPINSTPSNLTPGYGTALVPGSPVVNQGQPSPDGYFARSTPAETYMGTFQPPVSQDEAFNKYRQETQGLIDAINQSYTSQVNEVRRQTEASAVGAGTEAAIGGGNGGAGAARMRAEGDPKIAQIEASRRSDLEKVNQGIIKSAEDYAKLSQERATTSATNAIAMKDKFKTDASSNIATLAKGGQNWEEYKQNHPQEYQTLLQQLGGDANIADAIYANSIPKKDILSTTTSGSKAIVISQDPITGKTSAHTYDLGIDMPKNWTQQKIGTNSSLFYDPATFNPNDPSTFKMFSLDPLTGLPVTSDGTQGTTPGATGPESQAIITSTSTMMGVKPEDLSLPTSQAVANYGLANIVSGLIGQEGGSPKGVNNNPGNIKFVGLPGQTDSGVTATDGGTFASYASPQDGVKAVGELVTKAGDKPLSEFIASYKGLNIEPTKLASPKSGSILSATGISTPVFNYLTQGTASMSRMSPAQRNQIMNQATEFLNKNGIDISTFQSQYKAYNDTLSSNIQRANKTKIMENELIGTIDNLKTVVNDAELGSINAANVAKVFAGEQVNDPSATQYAFHFQQLKNELAGYFAASQGKNSPDVIDNQDAADAVVRGMATGSLEGLKNSIENSTSKMTGVLQNSVDSSRKDVWNLFGVGDKYVTKGQENRPIVEKVLNSKNINYNDFVSKAPKGSIPVIDKATNQVGYIPVEEYNQSKDSYISI